MKILNLAWRNVFRHTRRTVITAAAISVGLAVMLFMDTMMNGIDKMASKNIIDFETGAIQIFAQGYYREEGMFPLDTIIENPVVIVEKVENIKDVKNIVPRVKFEARLSDGIDELPVLGIGIDIDKEQTVFETPSSVVKGKFLENEEDILIGIDLARDMDLDVGSYLTVITRDRNGTYNAYDFTVSGLINTGHPLFDRNAALISIEVTQRLLAISDGVTELSIKIKNDEKSLKVKQEISEVIGTDYELYTWKELNSSVFQISSTKRMGQFIIVLVVVIIAAVGIVNTMLMAVMERIPEIGTLKAIGFNNYNIVKMFIYEGGIIGIFGSILGCFMGLLLSLYITVYGIDMSAAFKDMDIIYPIKFIIKGEINYQMILYVFIFGIIVSVVATLWPVRSATRLEPIDALRHV
ncbi:ABC transporter permease [candidate division WOR-3 bacterium]|nr:ABC transporter permease [candidate division WOR-3 bacterium]